MKVKTPLNLYEGSKALQPEYVTAIRAALEYLRDYYAAKDIRNKPRSSERIVQPNLFEFDFLEKPEANLKILNYVLDQLPSKDDFVALTELLSAPLPHLSKESDIHQLFSHILNDVGKAVYSDRPSQFIHPTPGQVLRQEASYTPGQTWPMNLQDLLTQKHLSADLFEKEEGEEEKTKPSQPRAGGGSLVSDISRTADKPNIPPKQPFHSSKLATVFKKKNLPPDLFLQAAAPSLSSDLSDHIQWAFKNVYSVAYPEDASLCPDPKYNIPRYIHGIQHVARTALYVRVFANLYRKYGDPAANQLTEDDIKLLQIAALFHDSAREGEGKDRWDHESGILLYCYLRKILDVPQEKAKLIAEAMANKDPSPKGYFTIIEENEQLWWEWNKVEAEKNIYQKLIHDADSLDIIRARPGFKSQYLDFYQDIVAPTNNEQALEELAHLVTEARSLIEFQGDSFERTNPEIKMQYNCEEMYPKLLNNIDETLHPILSALSPQIFSAEMLADTALIDLRSYEPSTTLTEDTLRIAMRAGKVFARGIASPSGINKKDQTLASLEITKMLRERGVPTTSTKQDREEKEGNPLRSVSLIGYGATVFSNAGFLIIDPNIHNIATLSAIDAGTGRGKKFLFEDSVISYEEKVEKLAALHKNIKLGGSIVNFGSLGFSTHVEIQYKINRVDAIFFSNDPHLYNKDAHGVSLPHHRYTAFLDAVFLQKEYENQYEKAYKHREQIYIARYGKDLARQRYEERYGPRTLPIFEYSSTHNYIKAIPPYELTDQNLKQRWLEICRDFIQKELNTGPDRVSPRDRMDIFNIPIEDMMAQSVYGPIRSAYVKKNIPPLSNYPDELAREIIEEVEAQRSHLLKVFLENTIQKVKLGQLDPLSDEVFFPLMQSKALVEAPSSLREIFIEKLRDTLSSLLSPSSITCFFQKSTAYGAPSFDELKPVNPNLNTTSFSNKNILFISTLPRLYAMLMRLNASELIAQINTFVSQTLPLNLNTLQVTVMKKTNNAYNTLQLLAEFRGLIKIAELFNVDIIEEDKKNIIQRFFDGITNACLNKRSTENIRNLTTLIDWLKDENYFNDEFKSAANHVHQNLVRAINIKFKKLTVEYSGYIRAIIQLSDSLNIDIGELIQQSLEKVNLKFNLDEYALLETHCRNIALKDDIRFEQLLNRISLRSFGAPLAISPYIWLSVVEHIRIHTAPDKIFTPSQKQMIDTVWLNISIRYAQDIPPAEENNEENLIKYFKILIMELKDILFNPSPVYQIKLKLDNPIVQLFNEYLQSIGNLKGVEKQLDFPLIRKLDYFLPGKELRESAIQQLRSLQDVKSLSAEFRP